MHFSKYFKMAEEIVKQKFNLAPKDVEGALGFDKMTDLALNFVIFTVVAVVGVVLITKFSTTNAVTGNDPNVTTNASVFINELEGIYLQIPDFAEILLFAVIGAIVIGAVLMYKRVNN